MRNSAFCSAVGGGLALKFGCMGLLLVYCGAEVGGGNLRLPWPPPGFVKGLVLSLVAVGMDGYLEDDGC